MDNEAPVQGNLNFKKSLQPLKAKTDEKHFPIIPGNERHWPEKFPAAWALYVEFLRGRPLSRLPYELRTIEMEHGWLRSFFLDNKIHYWSTPMFHNDGRREWYWEFEHEGHHAPGYPNPYPKNTSFETQEECDLAVIAFAWLALENLLKKNGKSVQR